MSIISFMGKLEKRFSTSSEAKIWLSGFKVSDIRMSLWMELRQDFLGMKGVMS